MEFDFDLENPFSTSTLNFPLLFHIETHHTPSKSYLQTTKSNPATRAHIVSLILCFCRNFDAFSSYLAINYMDRFLSAVSIPEERPWILRVTAVSCVSLALKMRKIEFSASDFQDDGGMILDSVTIERAEMLILGALKWRMRSVNPFSFINFFIPFFGIEDETSIHRLKDRATENILRAQNDIKLLEFNPSIISAAALLSVANELFPSQLPRFSDSISCCEYVSKVELFNCYYLMQERRDPSASDASSNSSTPYNVLDLQCYSPSNSENKSMSATSINAHGEIRAPKRPKFGDFGMAGLHGT
ncbi:putative cyclin-D6-1 isoform X2 [Salvia miltiorrhiza]|uniref:putative cyclin-D6-1 isoform X2 n=1 Tax=Salvia miltiorrhiza TaxID=226208 RepID=UPI0025ABD203|nr:putative cyclin-D6-1 isoform X2 [Salvia miltiorrhiza]